MDLLRLPSSLRRSLLSSKKFASQITRCLTTGFRPIADENSPPPTANLEPQALSPALLTLSPATLNSYTISIPPHGAQLKYAASFFHASPPEFLFSAAYFRAFPPSSFPEVVFLGRSNVGKSSLLNALFGRAKLQDAHVSKRPGRTRTMNGFGVAGGLPIGATPKSGEKEAAWKRFPRGGLIVVDMPGYGSGSREEWGTEAMKYLEQRKQLRRTFVLVDGEHGLKPTDIAILTHMRQRGISHQIVLSKVDKLLYSHSKPPGPQRLHNQLLKLRELCTGISQRLDAEAGDGRRSTSDVLCCSAEKGVEDNRKLGVDEIRWAVLSACGMEADELGEKKRRRLDDLEVLEEA